MASFRSSFPIGEKENIPSKASDECNKLIQVTCPCPTNHSTTHYDYEPENILLPLDFGICLPTFGEQAVLHDAHSGEQLKWDGEKDGERIQELNCLRESRGRIKIDEHNRLNIGTKR